MCSRIMISDISLYMFMILISPMIFTLSPRSRMTIAT
jgi:hypothetical protein